LSWENVEKMIADETVIDTKIIGFNKGGLIVAIGNLRGFVPSSQISATRRTQSTGDTPEQRWQKMVGQPISVKIIEVDRERRRLILSERAANTESRSSMKDRVIGELEEGKSYTGRVTSLADFGAFVNVNGADGLVHLSELSWDHLSTPRKFSKSARKSRSRSSTLTATRSALVFPSALCRMIPGRAALRSSVLASSWKVSLPA
jgi:small subunit ribosomal protein S1